MVVEFVQMEKDVEGSVDAEGRERGKERGETRLERGTSEWRGSVEGNPGGKGEVLGIHGKDDGRGGTDGGRIRCRSNDGEGVEGRDGSLHLGQERVCHVGSSRHISAHEEPSRFQDDVVGRPRRKVG